MMDFLDLARRRYATKKYDVAQPVSVQQIEVLKEIIRLSPSSINSQPWKFTFITDEAVKSRLAEHSFMNEQSIKDVNLLVVFSVMEELETFEEQNISILPEGWVGFYEQMVKVNGEAAVRTWMENQVYLSLGFFLSACISMGLDATPMEGIDRKAYANILGDVSFAPLFAVTVGHADVSDAMHPSVFPKSRFAPEVILRSI